MYVCIWIGIHLDVCVRVCWCPLLSLTAFVLKIGIGICWAAALAKLQTLAASQYCTGMQLQRQRTVHIRWTTAWNALCSLQLGLLLFACCWRIAIPCHTVHVAGNKSIFVLDACITISNATHAEGNTTRRFGFEATFAYVVHTLAITNIYIGIYICVCVCRCINCGQQPHLMLLCLVGCHCNATAPQPACSDTSHSWWQQLVVVVVVALVLMAILLVAVAFLFFQRWWGVHSVFILRFIISWTTLRRYTYAFCCRSEFTIPNVCTHMCVLTYLQIYNIRVYTYIPVCICTVTCIACSLYYFSIYLQYLVQWSKSVRPATIHACMCVRVSVRYGIYISNAHTYVYAYSLICCMGCGVSAMPQIFSSQFRQKYTGHTQIGWK